MAPEPHHALTLRTARAVLALSALAGGACLACPTSSRERAAVLTNPTAVTRSELSAVLEQALHSAPVRLADDALTRDSVLLIDRIQPRDAAGLPLDGRQLGRPERFLLITYGNECVLVHERTGRHYALSTATCAPADAPGARATPE
jgi:hypothetical protein